MVEMVDVERIEEVSFLGRELVDDRFDMIKSFITESKRNCSGMYRWQDRDVRDDVVEEMIHEKVDEDVFV